MKKYNITLSGYGAEVTIGRLNEEQCEILKKAKSEEKSFNEVVWDEELGSSWYELDDFYHNYNVGDTFTITIEDEEGNELHSFTEDILYSDVDFLDYQDKFTDTDESLIMCVSGEKGVFFEATLELEEEFDLSKFKIMVDEEVGIPGTYFGDMLSKVYYDGEELDNWGGSTDGKYFDVYTNLKFE
jgi:hypothetical protein